jgi:hypothetical protein
MNLAGTMSGMLEKEEEAADKQIFGHLKHKMSSRQEQNQLIRLYHSLSMNKFEHRRISPERLRAIYGANSTIVKFAMGEGTSRNGSYDPNESPSRHAKTPVHRQSLERMHDQYWTCAQKVLVDTVAFGELDSALGKYYSIDMLRKHNAAVKIQRFVRRRLDTVLLYERSMCALDAAATRRIINMNKAKDEILKDLQSKDAEKGLTERPRKMSSRRKNTFVTSGGDDFGKFTREKSQRLSSDMSRHSSIATERSQLAHLALSREGEFGEQEEVHCKTASPLRPRSGTSNWSKKDQISRSSYSDALGGNGTGKVIHNKSRSDVHVRIPVPDYLRPFPVRAAQSSRPSSPDAYSRCLSTQDTGHQLVSPVEPKKPLLSIDIDPNLNGTSDPSTDLLGPLATADSACTVATNEQLLEENSDAAPLPPQAADELHRPLEASIAMQQLAPPSQQSSQVPFAVMTASNSNSSSKKKKKVSMSSNESTHHKVAVPGTTLTPHYSAQEAGVQRLGKTWANPHGLPDDVFVDMQRGVSLTTGLQFLRSMSADPKLYVSVSRKERSAWMQARVKG